MFHVSECVKFMSKMDTEIVDLTVTSPPYDDRRCYNGYTFDFESIANELYRITKQGGVVVWVVADKTENGSETGTSFRQALYFKKIGFNLHDTMIYAKGVRPNGSNNCYHQCFEYMFVISKGIPKTINLLRDRKNEYIKSLGGKNRSQDGSFRKTGYQPCKEYGKRTNVWKYNTGLYHSTRDKRAFDHPAIFPEKLAEDHILSWSNEGDLVFDPMCGSGTTGKMALAHGRKFIGVDISEEYIEIARERCNTLDILMVAD